MGLWVGGWVGGGWESASALFIIVRSCLLHPTLYSSYLRWTFACLLWFAALLVLVVCLFGLKQALALLIIVHTHLLLLALYHVLPTLG